MDNKKLFGMVEVIRHGKACGIGKEKAALVPTLRLEANILGWKACAVDFDHNIKSKVIRCKLGLHVSHCNVGLAILALTNCFFRWQRSTTRICCRLDLCKWHNGNHTITAFYGGPGHYVDGKWVKGSHNATKLDSPDIEILLRV